MAKEKEITLKNLLSFFESHPAIKKELFLIKECKLKNRHQSQRLLHGGPELWELFKVRIKKAMIKYGYKG